MRALLLRVLVVGFFLLYRVVAFQNCRNICWILYTPVFSCCWDQCAIPRYWLVLYRSGDFWVVSLWTWTYVFDWKWHRVLSFTLWNVVLCSSVVIGDVTGSSMHPSFYWRRISPLMPCSLNLSSISKPSFSFCCNSSNLNRISLSKGLITPRLRTTFLITSFSKYKRQKWFS